MHTASPSTMNRLTMGALGFEVFLGSLTFTGSLMAFGKLQGIITGAPITWKGQNVMNIGAFFGALALLAYQVVFARHAPRSGCSSRCAASGFAARRARGAADRRRRHAGRHLAAQLVRRPRRLRDGLRAQEQHPHHLRRARRLVRLPALA